MLAGETAVHIVQIILAHILQPQSPHLAFHKGRAVRFGKRGRGDLLDGLNQVDIFDLACTKLGHCALDTGLESNLFDVVHGNRP